MDPDVGFPHYVSGVIFDLDGTLVNSNQAVERIWRNWAKRAGIEIDQILSVSHGRRTIDTLRLVAPLGCDPELEANILAAEELIETEGIFAVPGAAEFIGALEGYPWAIVTSAPRKLAVHRLAVAGLTLPQHLLSAEDVAIGKPDPMGYLRAADWLAVAPEKLLIFEDSPAGLAAAHAAGARVLALATTLTPDKRLCENWISDFTELSLEPCDKFNFHINRRHVRG